MAVALIVDSFQKKKKLLLNAEGEECVLAII